MADTVRPMKRLCECPNCMEVFRSTYTLEDPCPECGYWQPGGVTPPKKGAKRNG